jgi:hypothetical protein
VAARRMRRIERKGPTIGRARATNEPKSHITRSVRGCAAPEHSRESNTPLHVHFKSCYSERRRLVRSWSIPAIPGVSSSPAVAHSSTRDSSATSSCASVVDSLCEQGAP